MKRLVLAAAFALFGIYLTHQVIVHDLMGPNLNYGDGTYLYVTGAVSFWDATNEIKVPHPGITSMLVTSWFYRGLDAIGLLGTSTFGALTSAENPIKELLDLTVWAKVLSVVICLVYLALIYAVVRRLFGSVFCAWLAVAFNLFYVGVVFHFFLLRPDPLACVFILTAVLCCLRFKEKPSPTTPFKASFAVGFFLAAILATKINALYFAPIILYFYVRLFGAAPDLTTRDYIKQLLPPLIFVMGTIVLWINAWDPAIVPKIVAEKYAPLAQSMLDLSATTTAIALTAFMVMALAALTTLFGKHTRLVRLTCICFFSAVAAAAAFFLLFTISGAPNKMVWAQTFVARAIGQTVYFGFLSGNYVEAPRSLVALFFNNEIRHVAAHQTLFLAVTAAALFAANARVRIRLVAGLVLLFGLTLFSSLRSSATFTPYYQIYLLMLETPIFIASVRILAGVWQRVRLKPLAFVLLLLLFVNDLHFTRTYHERMFAVHETPAHALGVLDYWGNGMFTDRILKPRYCAGMEEDACRLKLEKLFSDEEARYH